MRTGTLDNEHFNEGKRDDTFVRSNCHVNDVPNTITVSNVSDCVVSAKLFSRQLPILIDSGAFSSLIHTDLVNQIPELKRTVVPIKPIHATTVTEQPIVLDTQVVFPITIKSKTFTVKAYVCDKIAYKLILGYDFLTENKVQVNFEKPTQSLNKRSIKVRSLKNCYVKPNASYTIKRVVKTPWFWGTALCEGSFSLCTRDLIVTPTLCKCVGKKTIAYVTIFNDTDSVKHIHANTVIGILSNVDNQYAICNVHTDTSVSELSLPQEESSQPELWKADDLWSTVDKSNDLTDTQREQLQALVTEYRDIFYLPGQVLPEAKIPPMRITLKSGTTPFYIPPYKRSVEDTHILNREVDNLLQQKIIKPVEFSRFVSPVLLVAKKDTNDKRLVLDLRKLNKVTVPINSPLPTIANVLQQISLARPRYLTKLDFAQAFHSIPLHPDSQELISFRTNTNLYSFKRAVMGYHGTPSYFCMQLNEIFKNCLFDFAALYLDDMCLYSANFTDHLIHIRCIFDLVREHRLSLKPSKCQFAMQKIHYLSQVISQNGFEPDPAYVQVIKEFPKPRNRRNIQQFLGLLQYVRRFVKDLSIKAAPLFKLLHKDNPFVWNKECDDAFEYLRHALISKPILAFVDNTKPFQIYTDASNYAVGAIIQQDKHVIAYYGKALPKYCVHNPVYLKELFAIISVLEEFESILKLSPVTIYSDHLALQSLLSQKKVSSKVIRYVTYLTLFENLTIIHKKGDSMRPADCLSRLLYPQVADQTEAALDDRLFFPDIRPPTIQFPDTPLPKKDEVSNVSLNVVACDNDLGGNNPDISYGALPNAPLYMLKAPGRHTDKIKRKQPGLAKQRKAFMEATAKIDITPLSANDDKFKLALLSDKHFAPIIKYLSSNELPSDDKRAREVVLTSDSYHLQNGVLYFKFDKGLSPNQISAQADLPRLVLCIPESYQHQLLLFFHEEIGHFKSAKMYQSMRLKFYWKGMYTDIMQFCQRCLPCQFHQSEKKPNTPLGIRPQVPVLDTIVIDIAGPLPNSGQYKFVLFIVDSASSYVWGYPLISANAQSIAKKLVSFCFQYGHPRVIISDMASYFTGAIMTYLCQLFQITPRFSSPRHAASHGKVENIGCKTILSSLAKYLHSQHHTWMRFLPAMLAGYNSSIHLSSKFSPFYLMFGREYRTSLVSVLPEVPVDNPTLTESFLQLQEARRLALKNLNEAAITAKQCYDRKGGVQENLFEIGDLVFLHAQIIPPRPPNHPIGLHYRAKWLSNYLGPFRIEDIPSPNHAKLRHALSDELLPRVVHFDRLRKFYGPLQPLHVADDGPAESFMPNQLLLSDHDRLFPTENPGSTGNLLPTLPKIVLPATQTAHSVHVANPTSLEAGPLSEIVDPINSQTAVETSPVVFNPDLQPQAPDNTLTHPDFDFDEIVENKPKPPPYNLRSKGKVSDDVFQRLDEILKRK